MRRESYARRSAESISTVPKSQAFVGKEKYRSRKIGFQSFLAVVAAQNASLPCQEIGIFISKCVPTRGSRARHPFANEKEIGMSDGFVVNVRLAASHREVLQGLDESFQRFQRRVPF